jgi:transcriptional regulator with XRE-family HTH domain
VHAAVREVRGEAGGGTVTSAARITFDNCEGAPEEAAGRELRRLREARRWSQEETARRMDAYGYEWHQTTVAKVEAAQRPLRLNEAADMCRLFGVTIAGLLSAVPGMTDGDLERQAAARLARLEDRVARAREALSGG